MGGDGEQNGGHKSSKALRKKKTGGLGSLNNYLDINQAQCLVRYDPDPATKNGPIKGRTLYVNDANPAQFDHAKRLGRYRQQFEEIKEAEHMAALQKRWKAEAAQSSRSAEPARPPNVVDHLETAKPGYGGYIRNAEHVIGKSFARKVQGAVDWHEGTSSGPNSSGYVRPPAKWKPPSET